MIGEPTPMRSKAWEAEDGETDGEPMRVRKLEGEEGEANEGRRRSGNKNGI
jgi:hypothetical protein